MTECMYIGLAPFTFIVASAWTCRSDPSIPHSQSPPHDTLPRGRSFLRRGLVYCFLYVFVQIHRGQNRGFDTGPQISNLNFVFSHHKTPEVFLCRCTVGLGTPSSGDGPGGSREGFPCFRGSPVSCCRSCCLTNFLQESLLGNEGRSTLRQTARVWIQARAFSRFSAPSSLFFRRVGEAESYEDVLFPSSGSMDLRIRIRENFIRPFRLSSV